MTILVVDIGLSHNLIVGMKFTIGYACMISELSGLHHKRAKDLHIRKIIRWTILQSHCYYSSHPTEREPTSAEVVISGKE